MIWGQCLTLLIDYLSLEMILPDSSEIASARASSVLSYCDGHVPNEVRRQRQMLGAHNRVD